MPYLGNSLSVGSSAVTASASALASFTNTYSVDFDGVDDYINADALDLNSEIGTGDVSIAFWVKFDDLTGDNYIFYFGKDSGNFDYIFSRYANSSSKIELVFREGGGGGTFTLDWDTTPSIDTWYHVGFSRTGSTAKLYIDGAMVDSGTNAEIASPLGAVGDTTTTIGAFRTGIVPLNGHLDEFTIWNSILTDAEFAEIAAEPIDLSANFGDYVSSANVLANWRCEDGSGTNLEDSSGNGYDATLTNGPTFSTDVPAAAPYTNTYSVDFDGTDDYAAADGFVSSTSSETSGSFVWYMNPDDATPGGSKSPWSYADDNGNEVLFPYISTAGKLIIILRVAGTNQWVFETDSAPFSDETWTHCALVHNGTEPVFYINGSAVAITFTTSTDKTAWLADLTAADVFRIGVLRFFNSTDYNQFSGKIDELGYTSTALSSGQVSDIYAAGGDLSNYSPIGYWRMGDNNGGTGTTITDQGSGGNDATLTNGPTFSTDVPT